MDISRQARGFVTRPSAKRADELLSLSRNQPTTMTGLLISNFGRVLYVVCFLLGNSPASEFDVLEHSVCSIFIGK
jgi:hypothetical protein